MSKDRTIIGFILPSPSYNRRGEFIAGEYNGYIAIPKEFVKEEWLKDGHPHFPGEQMITLCKDGEWVKDIPLYNNVRGDVRDVDNSYQIFGWDYAHCWHTKENTTFDIVKEDVERTIILVTENIEGIK